MWIFQDVNGVSLIVHIKVFLLSFANANREI